MDITASWALLCGARRTGKTSLARELVAVLRARGLSVAGVLQEAVEEGGERVAYEAVRLRDPRDRVVVARRRTTSALVASAICSFDFDAAAFAEVRTWLEVDTADVIVIDEVSKAESRGQGHAAAIELALCHAPLVVLCVRADELVSIVERFSLPDAIAVLETGAPEAVRPFTGALIAFVETRKQTARA